MRAERVEPRRQFHREIPHVDDHVAELVDPRDISWEVDEPEFRVLLYYPSLDQATAETGFSTAMYRLNGCSVSEAVAWARSQQSGGYVLYVIVRSEKRVGAVRLEGVDPLRGGATRFDFTDRR